MLIKDITYEDLNGDVVTEKFYFNLSKLEIAEKDLYTGGLEEKARELARTEDAVGAWEIFKDIVIMAYGRKSEDGKRFIKKDPVTGRALSEDFLESPASSELLVELVTDSKKGAEFIEACLPRAMVEEVRRMEARGEKPAPDDETPVVVIAKEYDDYTDEQLLAMSDEEYAKLVPSKMNQLNKRQLQIGMKRMSAQ